MLLQILTFAYCAPPPSIFMPTPAYGCSPKFGIVWKGGCINHWFQIIFTYQTDLDFSALKHTGNFLDQFSWWSDLKLDWKLIKKLANGDLPYSSFFFIKLNLNDRIKMFKSVVNFCLLFNSNWLDWWLIKFSFSLLA